MAGSLEHGKRGCRQDLGRAAPIDGFGGPTPVPASIHAPRAIGAAAVEEQLSGLGRPAVTEAAKHGYGAQPMKEVVVPVVRPVDVQPLTIDHLSGAKGTKESVLEQQFGGAESRRQGFVIPRRAMVFDAQMGASDS